MNLAAEKPIFKTIRWWIMSIIVIVFLGFIAWQIWKANQYNQAVDYIKQGEEYRNEGHWTEAEEMYLKSIKIFQELTYQEGVAWGYENIDIKYLKM